MVKNKYPKNRKKADYGSMDCMKCGDQIIKQVNNMKYCKECRIIVTKEMMKENHIKRWENKEHRIKTLEYNKKWKGNNKDKVSLHEKKRRLNSSEEIKNKVRAREIVRKLPIGKECGICKSTENLQKHHWRYDKPELFSTLCSYCHKVQHLKRPKKLKMVATV